MIFFDTTKTGRRGRRSGLDRVSARLRESFGKEAQAVAWDEGLRDLRTGDRVPLRPRDSFLTSELFSEDERPGFTAFLAARPCRLAAIFHDAIPLQHPHITWPQSVARHPGYMKLLSRFDRVWAVSEASRTDLIGFWQWQRVEQPPAVDVLALGADFNGRPRLDLRSHSSVRAQTSPHASTEHSARASEHARSGPARPQLLCLGIIEPRKNQSFLLDVCEDLWSEGLGFELHVVGRVNPHFGAPIVAKIKTLRRARRTLLHFHEAASDQTVAHLYATSRASVFPTMAEGCGLPLIESLWMGVPCVCSDLPVLRENANGGGCISVPLNDHAMWKAALRRVLTDEATHERLVAEAATRPLATWKETAAALATALR